MLVETAYGIGPAAVCRGFGLRDKSCQTLVNATAGSAPVSVRLGR